MLARGYYCQASTPDFLRGFCRVVGTNWRSELPGYLGKTQLIRRVQVVVVTYWSHLRISDSSSMIVTIGCHMHIDLGRGIPIQKAELSVSFPLCYFDELH